VLKRTIFLFPLQMQVKTKTSPETPRPYLLIMRGVAQTPMQGQFQPAQCLALQHPQCAHPPHPCKALNTAVGTGRISFSCLLLLAKSKWLNLRACRCSYIYTATDAVAKIATSGPDKHRYAESSSRSRPHAALRNCR